MFTATPDYQPVHFVVCNYICQPEQAMVLYQLYFSPILEPTRALFLLEHATHVLWFFDSAVPDLMHWLELISITSLLKKGFVSSLSGNYLREGDQWDVIYVYKY